MQVPFKPIRAKTINYGIEARNLIDKITVAAPLEMSRGPEGITIRYAGPNMGRVLAVSSSLITACSGVGGNPGSGTATVYAATATPGTVSLSATYTVYNWSVNKTVPTNTNVMLAKINGLWFVDWADCAS
jgi:hypothetical protein